MNERSPERIWAMVAVAFLVLMVAALSVAGYLIVGEQHDGLRLLFLASLTLCVLAVVVALWGQSSATSGATVLKREAHALATHPLREDHDAWVALPGVRPALMRLRRMMRRTMRRYDPLRDGDRYRTVRKVNRGTQNGALALATTLPRQLDREQRTNVLVALGSLLQQAGGSDDQAQQVESVERARIGLRLVNRGRQAVKWAVPIFATSMVSGLAGTVLAVLHMKHG